MSDSKPPSAAELNNIKEYLGQNQERITDVMQRNLNNLDPEDRAVLQASKEVFLNHCTAGFWLGAGAGVAFVMRSRFAGASKSGLPKLFYPVKGQPGVNALPAGRLFRVFKTVGAGVGGSLIGLQIGVITGSRSGKKVLESRPGVQERATAAMTAAGEEVSKILSEAKTGGELGNSNSNNRSEMTGENDKSFYGQNEFSNEPSTSNYNSDSRPASSIIGDETQSRWDELRKQRAAPPSTWDNIRQSTGRESLPETQRGRGSKNSSRSTGDGNDSLMDGESLPEPGSDEMYGNSSKEAQQKEFDAMMEKERKGSSSSGFSNDGTWRG